MKSLLRWSFLPLICSFAGLWAHRAMPWLRPWLAETDVLSDQLEDGGV